MLALWVKQSQNFGPEMWFVCFFSSNTWISINFFKVTYVGVVVFWRVPNPPITLIVHLTFDLTVKCASYAFYFSSPISFTSANNGVVEKTIFPTISTGIRETQRREQNDCRENHGVVVNKNRSTTSAAHDEFL